jgi:hypothetical protein
MFTGTLDLLKGPVSTVNKIDGEDLISTAPAEVRLSVCICVLCGLLILHIWQQEYLLRQKRSLQDKLFIL